LGFINPHATTPLAIHTFPTKIGGLPLHLNPTNPLPATTCATCNDPLILLAQIYTAEDFPDEAYHRYIYLLVCRRGSCHKHDWRKCTRVLRTQLPLDNPWFATDPDTEESIELPLYAEKAKPTCAVCGCKAASRCAGCGKVWYCSRTHQQADWAAGMHAGVCKGTVEVPPTVDERMAKLVKNKWIFPELELVSEPEILDQDNVAPGALVKLPAAPIPGEDAEDSETGVDKAFLKFQKHIEPYPGQILRYLRVSSELAPMPLYVSDVDKPDAASVPACPRCHAPRELECQLLSTVLAHLPLDLADPDSYDFGTYFVYTCPENCELEGEFAEEVIVRQDFSGEGMAPMGQRAGAVVEGLKEQGVEVEL
ncbi:programmed cell death protein 2, partial [Catenaria anguillulae PL171]